MVKGHAPFNSIGEIMSYGMRGRSYFVGFFLLRLSLSLVVLAIGIQSAQNVCAAEAAIAVATSQSLQQRIDQAKPGDVITVEEGSYSEPLNISKPLTLKGDDPEKCILKVSANQPAVSIESKGRVILEGVTIQWQLATSDRPESPPCAVFVKDTKATLRNCHVIAQSSPKRCPTALQSTGFSEVNVENCRFEGFEFCINFSGGAEGNITDCIVLKPGHCGITVYSDSKIEVARCIVTGSKYHGIRSTGGMLSVHDNIIAKNNNRGIYLGNKPARGQVRNNVILGNASGISAFGHAKVTISNNLFLNSSYVGLDTRASCQLTIKNNIFQDNAKGFVLVEEGGRSKVRLGKNSYWKNDADVENSELAAGSLTVDPQFQAPGQGNYSVQKVELADGKQGLSKPEVIAELWKKWENLSAEL